MKNILRATQSVGVLLVSLWFCCSCVQVQRSSKSKDIAQKHQGEIRVYTSEPVFRSYEETVKYEAIGSNISSFEQVLARVKSQARRDGCEALVHVKFYKQQFGSGKYSSAFPKIEATGVRFVD